jgi:hypothetical protein
LKRKSKDFWLIIKDDDRKEFVIEGLMADDNPWNKAVCEAQKQGRKVMCSSSSIEQPKEYLKRTCLSRGYKEAQTPIVVPDVWLP